MSGPASLEADSIQLHFCQRCGISIPVSDIESGRAQAAPGGFVCLACSYRSGAGEEELAPMPALAPPARDGGVRVLAAIALLYVVGATTFLLFREVSREAPVLDLSGVATARDIQVLARKVDAVDASYSGRVTYHDSCSSLREHAVKAQPRRLLASVDGLELSELEGTDICCGFGGTFCVKYPDISGRMAADKVAAIDATGADTLLAGDLGCLLNLAGKLRREGKPQRVYHVAEVLAGMADSESIGEGER